MFTAPTPPVENSAPRHEKFTVMTLLPARYRM